MTHPIYRVQTFEIVSAFILRVRFDDGTEQVINFQPIEEKAGQDEKESEAGDKKRRGSEKRSKTRTRVIHEERAIAPEAIPEGSCFKGYQDYVVQDLVIIWAVAEFPQRIRKLIFSQTLRQ
jgi:hypothetical protein